MYKHSRVEVTALAMVTDESTQYAWYALGVIDFQSKLLS